MRARFKVFRGTFTSWNSLLKDAVAFATEKGPENVISHSSSDTDGVVTVWYWR